MARSSTTFADGNKAALRHGAHSAAEVAGRASDIRARLVAQDEADFPAASLSERWRLERRREYLVKLSLFEEVLERETGGTLATTRAGKRAAADWWLELRTRIDRVEELLLASSAGPTTRAQKRMAEGARSEKADDAHRELAELYGKPDDAS